MTQMTTSRETLMLASRIVDQAGELSMRFARTYRKPLYPDGAQESDSEHTVSLGWMAIELHQQFYPHFDLGKIAIRVLVHDLVETEAGDTGTLGISENGLLDKKQRESIARKTLRKDYPLASTLLDLEEDYDCDRPLEDFCQEDSFVFVLDKIQPSITHRVSNFAFLKSLNITRGADLIKSVEQTTKRIERHRGRVPILCDLYQHRIHADARMLDTST